tara:strand:+ start:28580 stop:28861 length:282 start_codon:yes stop_codon:yes gene_type:complete
MKGRDYDYSFSKCLGTIEKQGWSKTKEGERKWRIKYTKNPCGWTDGVEVKKKVQRNPFSNIMLGEVTPSSATDEAHTDSVSKGPLTLSSYRHG